MSGTHSSMGHLKHSTLFLIQRSTVPICMSKKSKSSIRCILAQLHIRMQTETPHIPSKPIGVGIMPEKSQRQRQLFLSVKLLFQFPNLNYPERDTLIPYTNPVMFGMNTMASVSHIQEPSFHQYSGAVMSR